MLLLIVLSLVIVGAVIFLEPSRYLSVVTALPASNISADKARIFNKNIENLYSSIGNPDDLDKIIGTAQLDTVYLAVSNAFNLWDHYKIKDDPDPAYKAALTLKKNSKVYRSEYGELKIKVWATDKNLAPQLANAILDTLNKMHQSIQNQSNRHILNSLKEERILLQKTLDSASSFVNAQPANARTNTIMLAQLQQYDELIGEYQLTIATNPSVLVTVEKARGAVKPDQPRRVMVLVATAVLSFLFSLLVALILERRKRILL